MDNFESKSEAKEVGNAATDVLEAYHHNQRAESADLSIDLLKEMSTFWNDPQKLKAVGDELQNQSRPNSDMPRVSLGVDDKGNVTSIRFTAWPAVAAGARVNLDITRDPKHNGELRGVMTSEVHHTFKPSITVHQGDKSRVRPDD